MSRNSSRKRRLAAWNVDDFECLCDASNVTIEGITTVVWVKHTKYLHPDAN